MFAFASKIEITEFFVFSNILESLFSSSF